MRAVVVRVAIVRTAGLRLRRHSFGRSCRLSRFLGLRLRSRPVIAGASTRSGREASRPAALRRLPWRGCDEAPSVAARALLDGLNIGGPSVSVRRPSLRRCAGGGSDGCENALCHGGDMVHPIVQRRRCQRRRLAAERSHSSPLRQGQVAQLVGVPYGAMMPPTRYFSSCMLGPSL